MSSERRYSEDEIAEILERATEVREDRGRSMAHADGLTLDELKEIGEEAGISPDRITRAAAEVDRPDVRADANKRLLGARIGVGRTVHLPRRLTDDEWNRLVVDLRETFDARGSVARQGDFRQWNNGKLQALLEPTEDGERLRLKTLKTQGRMFLGFGGAMLAVVGVMALVPFLTGGDASMIDWESLSSLGLIGAAFMASQYVSLPGWARKRELQMEGVARRLVASVTENDADELPETAGE